MWFHTRSDFLPNSNIPSEMSAVITPETTSKIKGGDHALFSLSTCPRCPPRLYCWTPLKLWCWIIGSRIKICAPLISVSFKALYCGSVCVSWSGLWRREWCSIIGSPCCSVVITVNNNSRWDWHTHIHAHKQRKIRCVTMSRVKSPKWKMLTG